MHLVGHTPNGCSALRCASPSQGVKSAWVVLMGQGNLSEISHEVDLCRLTGSSWTRKYRENRILTHKCSPRCEGRKMDQKGREMRGGEIMGLKLARAVVLGVQVGQVHARWQIFHELARFRRKDMSCRSSTVGGSKESWVG